MTKESIEIVRGNPTADEIAAIVAALDQCATQGVACKQPRSNQVVVPATRRWGSPSTNLGLFQPDPWRRATGWASPI